MRRALQASGARRSAREQYARRADADFAFCHFDRASPRNSARLPRVSCNSTPRDRDQKRLSRPGSLIADQIWEVADEQSCFVSDLHAGSGMLQCKSGHWHFSGAERLLPRRVAALPTANGKWRQRRPAVSPTKARTTWPGMPEGLSRPWNVTRSRDLQVGPYPRVKLPAR